MLAELAGVSEEFAGVRQTLADPMIADARALADLRERIDAVHAEAGLDSRPKGWRDPAAQAYRARVRDRELELAKLRQDEQQLLTRSLALRDQAIGEELDRRPAWLEQALGPEPAQRYLQER